MRLKLTISYDGTPYKGWQKQDDKRTVQGEIEDAFFKITGLPVSSFLGSGRTDEGVHAINQIAHFDFFDEMGKVNVDGLVGAFNFYLPLSIAVKKVEIAPTGFNACKNAKQKTYCYDMYSGVRNPLLESRACWLDAKNIDFALMKKAASLFLGTHDFIAFRAKGSSATTTTRTISECSLKKVDLFGSCGYRLTITANGFLYKMVRIIAGTIIKAGTGKITIDKIKELLNSKQEWEHKTTAPACGLYLYEVMYHPNPK